MKLENLNNLMTFGANLGVILGIVFLVVEIRQNNELLAAQDRFNRLSVATESMTILAENPDLANFFTRANSGEELDLEENLRLSSYLRRTFTNMQWSVLELPESELPIEMWRQLYTRDSYRVIAWEEMKDMFDPEFVQYFDNQILVQ